MSDCVTSFFVVGGDLLSYFVMMVAIFQSTWC